MEAYRAGYFPMAEGKDTDELFWVRPQMRGIFPLENFHVSKSLRKVVRQDRFEVTVDAAFSEVMHFCASDEAGREDSWINDDIFRVYAQLHRVGRAHSVECWAEGQLVGGLYGVSIEAAFFGESMFSLRRDASKVALCHLVGRLRMAGYRLLDAQFLTDHLASLGAVEVSDAAYQIMLENALSAQADLKALPHQISGSSILQEITQTS